MPALTSAHNPAVKQIRKAVRRGGLTADGCSVAEGFHLLEEALRSGCEIADIFASESALDAVESRCQGLPITSLTDSAFKTLATTEHSQGVITLVRPRAWSMPQLLGGVPLVLIVDGVQDPGNAGALVRAAEAFGATGVIFLKGSVTPYNPKALRASAGSVFRTPLVVGAEEQAVTDALERGQLALYCLLPERGKPPYDCPLNHGCALVVGGEGSGVRAGLRARGQAIQIPTLGVESLNAAMAAGVALYEAYRQRQHEPL